MVGYCASVLSDKARAGSSWTIFLFYFCQERLASGTIFSESLILAQDERWQHA